MSALLRCIVFILICFSSFTASSQANDMLAGQQYFQKGEYEKAIESFSKALAAYPSSAVTYTLRGVSYSRLGKEKEALDDYFNAIRVDSNYANAYRLRGILYNKQGNTIAALTDLNKAVHLNPKDELSIFERAGIYKDKGQYELAITEYTAASKLNPKEPSTISNRGICYYALNRCEEAIADFTNAIELGSKSHNPYYYRGLCYQKQNLTDKAISDFSKAITIQPTVDYYFTRGNAYYASRQYEAAIADYKSILKLQESSSVYWDLGLCYDGLGMSDEAINYYTLAYKLDPRDTKPLGKRGDLYYNVQRYDEAIDDYTKVLKTNPKDPYVWFYRGLSYLFTKKTDKALSDINTGINLDPTNADGYINRGVYYDVTEKYDLAVKEYTKSSELAPNSPLPFTKRAWSNINIGEYDLATADFAKALAMDSVNYDALVGRATLHYFQKNMDKAIADFTLAISLQPNQELAYGGRSNVYAYIGEWEKAINDNLKSISLLPSSGIAYVNLFTISIHTPDVERVKPYLKIYKEKNLRVDHSTNWKFYDHYLTAMIDGFFQNNYELALKELERSEESFAQTPIQNSTVQNERKYGLIDVEYLKGVVLEKLGRFDEAKTAYEQTVALNSYYTDVKKDIERLSAKKNIAIKSDNVPPVIELLSPMTTRSFDIVSDDGNTPIVGQAKDESGIKSVSVNGKSVKVGDGGVFRDLVTLVNGVNTITIEATDKNDNKSTETFKLSIATRSSGGEKKDIDIDPLKNESLPTYYALIIANEDYNDPQILSLKKPYADAVELKNLLTSQYTFKTENVELLKNVTKLDLYESVWKMCKKMGENDNLLIFYAGHGWAVPRMDGKKAAFLIPVDAQLGRDGTYLSAYELNTAAVNCKAKNVLLMYDACYLGNALRSLGFDAPPSLQEAYRLGSMKIMTSGNDQRVPDDSKFMKYLRQYLAANTEKYVMASDIFHKVYQSVITSHDPTVEEATIPQYGSIPGSTDKGGEFIFIKKTDR